MRCSCGRPRPLNPTIIGIQYLGAEPKLILFNCECHSTRAIRWEEATRAQRVEAYLADEAMRTRSPEMMG